MASVTKTSVDVTNCQLKLLKLWKPLCKCLVLSGALIQSCAYCRSCLPSHTTPGIQFVSQTLSFSWTTKLLETSEVRYFHSKAMSSEFLYHHTYVRKSDLLKLINKKILVSLFQTFIFACLGLFFLPPSLFPTQCFFLSIFYLSI